MDWKHTAVVTGLTLAGAWAAGTPDAARPPVVAARPSDAEAVVPDIAAEALRLETRIRGEMTARALTTTRNPFRFGRSGGGRVEAEAEADAPVEPPDPETMAAEPEPAPAFRLIGMATDETPDGVSRTAILSGTAGVRLVRAGEEMGDGYRVGAIEADAVEVVTPDGVSQRLTLTP